MFPLTAKHIQRGCRCFQTSSPTFIKASPRKNQIILNSTLWKHKQCAANNRRCYSTINIYEQGRGRGIKISHLIGLLFALGAGATAWGLYDYFSKFTLWPKELRDDLRAGVKAKQQGSFDLSEKFFRRALEKAQSLPLDDLSPEPHLKLSGIAIILAEVLEANNKPKEAYEVYLKAFDDIRRHTKDVPADVYVRQIKLSTNEKSSSAQNEYNDVLAASGALTRAERVRAISLTYHLAGMAETYGQSVEEQEKFLVFAVTEALRILADAALISNGGSSSNASEHDLPIGLTATDVIAPMEALGTLFAKSGRIADALLLFDNAIRMLSDVRSKNITPESICKVAQLLNSRASIILENPGISSILEGPIDQLATAELDNAERAVQLAIQHEDKADVSLCRSVTCAIQYNKAMILEMQGKTEEAKQQYRKALSLARKNGSEQGIQEAIAALRRIQREEKKELLNLSIGSSKSVSGTSP